MKPEQLLNADNAALKISQTLRPMEGWDMPIFPSTYPKADKSTPHRHDTPYTLNLTRDGRYIATLDSVQSQANRMEAAFHGELMDYVPQIRINAGDHAQLLTQLPHRLADATIRATELGPAIRDAFEAYDAGDPKPIARLGPSALIYGAWDSRDTRVKIPRLIRSEIYAWDVDVFTRSAQFTGSFGREALGFTEKEWEQGAKMGFAPTPSVDQHGGVLVNGHIKQTTTLHLPSLNRLEQSAPNLGQYLLATALGAFLTGGRNYELRAGCWLVPDAAPEFHLIKRNGEESPIDGVEYGEVETLLASLASTVKSEPLEIPCGTTVDATYDYKLGKEMLKADKTEG